MASAAAAAECRLLAGALLPRYALPDKDLLLCMLARIFKLACWVTMCSLFGLG